MTLSTSNPRAKQRWSALLVLVCLGLLFAATAVSALTTTSPPSLAFASDENGADDQPGQKDLSAHAVNFNPSTSDLWVAWKWDVTSLSGGNTGDACALFDTDTDSNVNFAVCVTIGGNPAAQLAGVSPRIYTCGDAKVDRCTSTAALVAGPYETACSVNQSGLDRTDPFHSGQQDTTALCHIALSEVGATNASLVNTCSYPSQQPNSDPSDCVLIPRDAFLVIAKVATPNQGSFPFHVDGAATATFTAAGTQTSNPIAITSTGTHSVREAVPANWAITGTPSCTGASGPGSSNGTFSVATSTISGIDASPDNVVTCTFNDALQQGSILVTKVDGNSAALAGAGFTIDPGTPADATDDTVMTETATGVFCTGGLNLGTYTVTESTVPPGYNGASPASVTVTTASTCASRLDANGAPTGTVDAEFSNSPAPGSVTVQKNDDDDAGLAGVGFTLYVDAAPTGSFDAAIDTTVAAAEADTDATGLATFANIAPGFYCAVETTPLAGYAAASPNYACGQLVIGQNASLALGPLVNEQEHTVIVLVCHDATDLLAPSDVTIDPGGSDESTLTSLDAGTLTAAQQKALCDLGGATFSGLGHGDADLTVDVGGDAH